MDLDKLDRKIINILIRNSKLSYRDIAQAVGVSSVTILNRVKKLEQEGIIEKYVALINAKKVGGTIIVFCSVSLDVQKLPEIETFKSAVKELPEVLECYLMGGSNDFLLKVMVEDLEAYHQFSSGKLAALENVNQIKSTFVLDEVKKSTVIPTL